MWPLYEYEMSIGSASGSHGDATDDERPRRRWNSKQMGNKSRQRQQYSEEQQRLKLLASEGKREHEELDMEGNEVSA